MREHARLPAAPSAKDVAPDEREAYARVVERTVRIHQDERGPGEYFAALLGAPPLAAAIVQLGTLVRQGQLRGTYSDADRELVDMVLAADLDYRGHLPRHVPDAVAGGVRPEAIEAILHGREQELDDQERAVVTYAREVVAGTVSDASYEAQVERLGARGALEFTIFVGFLLMTMRLWQALGVSDPSLDEIDDLLARLRDGRLPVPDPAARRG